MEPRSYIKLGDEKKFSRKKFECPPSWLVGKAIEKEQNEVWSDACTEVLHEEVRPNADVIGFHMVYKIENKETEMRFEARFRSHRNLNRVENLVRKDSLTSQFNVTCLIASIMATNKL